MKRLLAIFLTLATLLSLISGCYAAEKTNTSKTSEESSTISTSSPSAVNSQTSSSKPEVKKATQVNPKNYATTKNVNNFLNLRSKADINSASIAKIPANATFLVKNKVANQWYEAEYDSKSGFVSIDYVELKPIYLFAKGDITLSEKAKIKKEEVVTVVGLYNETDYLILVNNVRYNIKMNLLTDVVPKVDIKGYTKTVIGNFSTRYSTVKAQQNRNTNMEIACNTINGLVLSPGQIFNWNKFVGQTTKAKGYKPAPVIVGKSYALGYGGGICQVSSTLYNSALQAKFEIIERHPHSHPMAYMHGKPDATIAYPSKNLIFKNTLSYPTQIEASAKGGIVKVAIYKLTKK